MTCGRVIFLFDVVMRFLRCFCCFKVSEGDRYVKIFNAALLEFFAPDKMVCGEGGCYRIKSSCLQNTLYSHQHIGKIDRTLTKLSLIYGELIELNERSFSPENARYSLFQENDAVSASLDGMKITLAEVTSLRNNVNSF